MDVVDGDVILLFQEIILWEASGFEAVVCGGACMYRQ